MDASVSFKHEVLGTHYLVTGVTNMALYQLYITQDLTF